MTLVTAGELIAFGAKHGLAIHPARDPEQWAEDINNNGGACVCDPSRRCPCPEAVSEAGASHLPAQQQCCVCRFYVSDNYIAHYYPNGVPVSEVVPVVASPTTFPEPQPSQPVDPEVVAIAGQVVDSIDVVLSKFDAGKYDIVFDDLVSLSEALECEVCGEAVMTEAIHVSNVRNVCDYSPSACAEEQGRVRNRLVELQQMYVAIRGTAENDETETLDARGPRPLPPYHTRMSECLTSDKFEGLDKKRRFCGCSKLSSNKATTEEEAIELCTMSALGGVDG